MPTTSSHPSPFVRLRCLVALVALTSGTAAPQWSAMHAPGWCQRSAFGLLWAIAAGRIAGEVDGLLRDLLARASADDRRHPELGLVGERRVEVAAWAIRTISDLDHVQSVRQLARLLERNATDADLPHVERLLALGVTDREARHSLERLCARLASDGGE